MSEEGVNFSEVDGKYKIATAQIIDEDELLKRIAGIEIQKHRFQQEIVLAEAQIEQSKETIELQKKNIAYAEEDLMKAYEFLRTAGKEELIVKIENAFKAATTPKPEGEQ